MWGRLKEERGMKHLLKLTSRKFKKNYYMSRKSLLDSAFSLLLNFFQSAVCQRICAGVNIYADRDKYFLFLRENRHELCASGQSSLKADKKQ